ncbi:MAG: amidohydrolase family protein [Acidimicrobiales bacterium]
MRTGVTLRTLDGAVLELAIDGERFAPPDAGPLDAELDTAGWWALPGLADCHAHLGSEPGGERLHGAELADAAAQRAFAQLRGGVFLVADKGAHDEATLTVLTRPPTERPDLHMAGRVVTAPGGYLSEFATEVDEAGLAAAVAATAARSGASGATWVKLIGDWPRRGQGAPPNFGEEALAEAVAVAHRAGCRTAIHTCAPRTASMAVAAGVDSIEHGLFLTTDDVAALGARGGAWVPTITNMEAVAAQLGPTSSGGRLFVDGLDNLRGLLPGAPAAGVAVLAGSDLALPHGGIAPEAGKLVEYGLSPEAALHAITTAAYDYLGQPRGFAAGLPADALFFDQDPREDLSVLARPRLVLRHGRVLG